jgi:hypothetical protein
MANQEHQSSIDFTVDQKNLYREENITDMKVAAIRKMTPITPSGAVDESRTAIFVGTTQLMTPEGPLPIQAMLQANSLQEAFEVFPKAMEAAMMRMIEQIQQAQQAQRKKDDSRIIVPGR